MTERDPTELAREALEQARDTLLPYALPERRDVLQSMQAINSALAALAEAGDGWRDQAAWMRTLAFIVLGAGGKVTIPRSLLEDDRIVATSYTDPNTGDVTLTATRRPCPPPKEPRT